MKAPPTQAKAPLAYLDPGWLYLLAGMALLAATIILPAMDDLQDVQIERDRMIAVERHRADRIARYRDYRDALDREEPSLVMALAASQLNLIPQGRTLALQTPHLLTAPQRASIFPALEPAPLTMPERRKAGSLLERLTDSDFTRPWLIAGGALCLMLGLLPRAEGGETSLA